MADTKDLSTYHMSANIHEFEPARTGFFSFIVEGLDDLVRSDFDLVEPTDEDYLPNAQEVIRLSVAKASIPHFGVEDISFRRGNSVIHFAGVPTFDDGQLTVDDFVGQKTKEVLMAWQGLTYNVNTDKGGRAGDWTDEDGIPHKGYKKNCKLIEYTQDHQPIRTWELIGCFPSKLSETGYDKSTDEKCQITMDIKYDRARLLSDLK